MELAGLGLMMMLLAALGWALHARSPSAAKWFTVFSLTLIVVLTSHWLHLPSALIWLTIPTGLAAAFMSFPAAFGTALCETGLLLGISLSLSNNLPDGTDRGVIGMAIGLIWATLGLMDAVYLPIQQLVNQVETYSEHTLQRLEEARNRKAELAQVVTDLTNANRQLALAGERMKALRTVAEEAEKTKASFVANVSHEFRTPLNMIIGLVEMMVEMPQIYDVHLSPKMRQDLNVVFRNCEHLSKMINDVLDLTRMETGYLVLHQEKVDLREIVEDSLLAISPLVKKKHLDLDLLIPDELPSAFCDRTRVQQVILNLLSNAARFTNSGTITVQISQSDQEIRVRVTDTGPGIPAKDIETIFEPFHQGTGKLWQNKGGSGLGLSISQRFIKLHGGRMWVESSPGRGTSFFFTLPTSLPAKPLARPGHQINEEWIWHEHAFRTDRAMRVEDLVKPRVIVHDETGGLGTIFGQHSGEVEFVNATGLSAITEALRKCPAHAIFVNADSVDRVWTHMAALRQEIPSTPIIGCSIPQQIERVTAAGAHGYLVKPVTRKDLVQVLENTERVTKVLVVDDDSDTLNLYKRMLQTCARGLTILTASSGTQALKILEHTSVDLLLLDVVMEDLSGWKVLENAHKRALLTNTKVIFVSAQDPTDRVLTSEFLLLTGEHGVATNNLLRWSLGIGAQLLSFPTEPHRVTG